MKHLALILLIASGSVSAADTEPEVASSPSWPAYRCHAEQEGRGWALKGAALKRLQATEKMPAAEAIAALEALLAALDPASGSRHWITATLAWRYQDAERRDELRSAALQTINDPYVVGQTADSMWALAAQSYADDGNWSQVLSLLRTMVDSGCRPVADPMRRLLAVALIKTEDYAAALEQFDRTCMVDEPEQRTWMRTALEVDCRLNGPPACVDRIVRYAKGPAPSEELQQMLNTALAQLAADAVNRPLLDQWLAQGLLTADYQVIVQAPPMVAELKPKVYIRPEIPMQALHDWQSGFVKLMLTVGTDGRVLDVRVLDASPPGVFEASAMAAAKKGRFHPRVVDGKPQQTEGEYSIFYKFGDGRRPEKFNRVQAAVPASLAAGLASAPDAHPFVPRCR